MKELEKKELNATELENKDLEKVNGGDAINWEAFKTAFVAVIKGDAKIDDDDKEKRTPFDQGRL